MEKLTLECPECGEECIDAKKKTSFSPSRRGHGRDTKIKLISVECEECGAEKSELRKGLKDMGYPIRP
jgi:endogenous inhibitor of DNA gyrase (YacG/DUF329 family)